MNDSFYGEIPSQITIFHNNVRSLNANLNLVDEIFQNCTKLPDIFAFTETKLNEEKEHPLMGSYTFEGKNSTSNCGGVGLYISNALEYSQRPDLSLLSESCEDLWIQIEGKEKISSKKYKKWL